MIKTRAFLDGRVVLWAGDCREVLRSMADNSVDSVVTDPPYHLTSIVKRFGGKNAAPAKHGTDGAFKRASGGFMGRTWDGGDIAFQTDLWAEVLRVIKPGGYIMAFSGCRTYHHMACAIEDAGFITHPMFAWCFGSGFTKAHNLSKQLDKMAGIKREIIGKANGAASNNTECLGDFKPEYDLTIPATDAAREWDGWFYGTQSLKPALEPVYFGQKPFERGLNGAQNVLKWGVGAINVRACKIPAPNGKTSGGRGHSTGAVGWQSSKVYDNESSRCPANLIHDGSDEVLACFPDVHGAGAAREGRFGSDYDATSYDLGGSREMRRLGDSGSSARFFASFPQDADKQFSGPKVKGDIGPVGLKKRSTANESLGGSPYDYFAQFPQDDVQRIFYTSKAGADDRLGSRHPTVKPIDLIQYLVRLITQKNGVCLDLFAGTGTTAEACFREGFRSVLIENDLESIADIERRMSLVMEGPDTRAYASAKARNRPRDDGPLFGWKEEFREPNVPDKYNSRNPYLDEGGHNKRGLYDEAADDNAG